MSENTNTLGISIGELLVEIYELEAKLGNTQELKRLKKNVLIEGATEYTVELLNSIRKLADPISGLNDMKSKFMYTYSISEPNLPLLVKEAVILNNSEMELDLDEWVSYIEEWHSHCKTKPFFKNLVRVATSKRLDSDNFKVIKAISSAYTHLAIEAEQDPSSNAFFETVGDSLLKCSNILHSKQSELYPLVIAFLSQLFYMKGDE